MEDSYEKIRCLPELLGNVWWIANHRVNMSNGTGWHVQTVYYSKNMISVGIDRKGFFLFKSEKSAINILTKPESLRYMCEKLNLVYSDGEGMQRYFKWLFERVDNENSIEHKKM